MATTATRVSPLWGWARSRAAAARMAWAVVLYNVLVIVWGALVRATGSGAGCGSHWPLCNGEVVPIAPRLDTVIEFTHRAMTGGATVLVLGLVLLCFQATRKGELARVLAAASALLLVNEAILGALLVKLGYVTTNRSVGRVLLLSVHLSNTLLLLAALTLTAVLIPTGIERRGVLQRGAGRWLVNGLGLLATLLVGVTGSLAALGDTLFPSTTLKAAMLADLSAASPMLLRVRWVHPVSAVLSTGYVLWLLSRVWRGGRWGAGRWLLGLLALQFVLGAADVLWLAPTALQLLHLAGADALWVALVALTARETLVLAERRSGAEALVRPLTISRGLVR